LIHQKPLFNDIFYLLKSSQIEFHWRAFEQVWMIKIKGTNKNGIKKVAIIFYKSKKMSKKESYNFLIYSTQGSTLHKLYKNL